MKGDEVVSEESLPVEDLCRYFVFWRCIRFLFSVPPLSTFSLPLASNYSVMFWIDIAGFVDSPLPYTCQKFGGHATEFSQTTQSYN